MADNKERPMRIPSDEEISARNLERIFMHYDEIIRNLQEQINELEERIEVLEAA